MPRSKNRLASFSPRPWPQVVVPPGRNEALFPGGPVAFARWRAALKMFLLSEIDMCWCGEAFRAMPHMHEGIYSRRDVQGWPDEWKVLIQSIYNCILLCRDCNLGLNGKNPPARERVLHHMVDQYGLSVVQWCSSLPFKENPIDGLLQAFD